MATDFTTSAKERQNVLNNRYALAHAERHLSLGGVSYDGETVFTKQQLIELFNISEATIERYITGHADELKANGYRLIKGKNLKDFKDLAYGALISEGTKTSILGLFSFRSLLNLAMLLTESEQAKIIRSRLLDIVIDVMAERSGGHTKFINQRDQDYLPAAFQEYNHRAEFTSALSSFLDMGPLKFGMYTNKIYQAIFHENAAEYKKVLRLAEKDNMRETLYAEVIRAIASFESGLASDMKNFYDEHHRKLKPVELDLLIKNAENNPYLKPVLSEARTKMASRDLCFREALHEKLEGYIQTVPEGDFERFLGETSKSLEARLADPELLAVFKRLKDR
ncbi:DNA-binding protein [Pseudomonas sp. MH10]|uniref:DNA-binding protein n=1 Tax=Pseudomonas sp. MH10 TaxID=3048627 RepID=UPI002AC913FF|nr:DNA-binding protein [Pseudomonas sp. MH10]MEB0039502.1 DNA-binding protein [Pseudomonas sp. MH10]WPX62436.1 DNA-binding protein [Pseudomonas sp. MH10]